MSTAVEYGVLVAAFLAGLSVIGWPVKVAMEKLGRGDSPITSPLAGLCVLQVATWYWLTLGGSGVGVPAVTVLVAGALASGVLLLFTKDWRAGERFERHGFALGTFAAAAVVIALNFSSIFHLSYLTTSSIWNADAVSYAVHAKQLVSHGFSDPGPVAGYDMGEILRTDAFGSNAVMASFSAVSGIAVWRITMVVEMAFVVLGIYHLALLVRELLPARRVVAVLVAATSCSTFLFLHVAGQMFMGQLMAMACLPPLCIVGLRAARATKRRATVAYLLAGAAVLLVVLSHYAYMAPLALAVVAPAAVLASPSRLWRPVLVRRLARVAVVFGGGGAVAVLLVPQWLLNAADRADVTSSAAVGYALPGFLPSELLGFGDRLANRPSAARILVSAAIIIVFLVSAWAIRERSRVLARFAIVSVAAVLASYLVLYLHYDGPSYRQWKWISFFQPLFAAMVLAVVAAGACELVARRSARVGTAVAWTFALVVACVVAVDTGNTREGSLRGSSPPVYANLDDSDLSTEPALRQLDTINIDRDELAGEEQAAELDGVAVVARAGQDLHDDHIRRVERSLALDGPSHLPVDVAAGRS